jgi:hypothetical protein
LGGWNCVCTQDEICKRAAAGSIELALATQTEHSPMRISARALSSNLNFDSQRGVTIAKNGASSATPRVAFQQQMLIRNVFAKRLRILSDADSPRTAGAGILDIENSDLKLRGVAKS